MQERCRINFLAGILTGTAIVAKIIFWLLLRGYTYFFKIKILGIKNSELIIAV